MSLIEVDRVSKFYGRVLGLNDISVSFKPGITGLLGPNGAGKSTLIKLLTGQNRPNLGRITVLDQPVWNNPSLNRRIGYCPEQDSFYNNMSGLEFVTFCAKLSGLGAQAEARSKAVLKRLDLAGAMNRRIGGYSKGMRQRVKMAQSMVHDPEVYIMDEPLTGTDPLGRITIMNSFKDLVKEGKHVVVSSHILHEVERMTSNIILINKGKLIAQGSIQDIRDSMDRYPLNIRVQSSEAVHLAKMLMEWDIVTSVSFPAQDRRTILVKTTSPARFYPEFQELVRKNKVPIAGVDSPDDNLDAIFKYLVG
jgi:ABC-2 type transport system ATP-binding protein